MSDTTTTEYVEKMMRSSLDDLALTAKAYDDVMDVSHGGDALVPKGEGVEASRYARELVVDAGTPKHAACTDFILALGGPRVWVRSWTRTEDAAIYGQSGAMRDPIKWPIERGTEAYRAVELFLDFDVMEDAL